MHAGSLIIGNLKSIATSFTPTTDLFDDGSEVSFVSYFFGMNTNKKAESPTQFFLPSNLANQSTSSEHMLFNGQVISSVANGTVSSIGYTSDNKKYIEIKHTQGYISIYTGVKMVGVTLGERVSAKNPIALLDGNGCKIEIKQNGNIVNLSEIEWKK